VIRGQVSGNRDKVEGGRWKVEELTIKNNKNIKIIC
jgi:hypothetical protein